MIIVKETAGDTLQGAIDGVNKTYVVSFDFLPSYVNIHVNGRLKVAALDDGYSVIPPRTVTLNEALIAGDSLEIEYQSDIATGGGAEGGCPLPPEIVILNPETRACENVPSLIADELGPEAYTEDDLKSGIFSDDLKPVIVHSQEG